MIKALPSWGWYWVVLGACLGAIFVWALVSERKEKFLNRVEFISDLILGAMAGAVLAAVLVFKIVDAVSQLGGE